MRFETILAVPIAIIWCASFSRPMQLDGIRSRIVREDSKPYSYFKAVFEDGTAVATKKLREKTQVEMREQKALRMRVGRNRRSTGVDPTEDSALNFSFSDWGAWSNCTSSSCESEGKQWAYRTCLGSDLETEQVHRCTFENLVRSRSCRPEHCNGVKLIMYRWAEWTKWSECSVTCGRGGTQRRTRPCTKENNITAAFGKCIGPQMEERECQYSSSCPTWDDWGPWGPCSDTCGGDGLSYRKRSCIVYRYFVSGLAGERESDAVDHEENTGTVIFQAMAPIYILDAAGGISLENATFFDGDTLKEETLLELCLRPNDLLREQKLCSFQGDCQSRWTSWEPWSACQRSCAPGFTKRERNCIENALQEPCEGQKTMYRRCYPPPCWEPWVTEGSCSVTCGTGHVVRRRSCKLYSRIPPHDNCVGEAKGVANCTLQPCVLGDSWTEWSSFSRCTVSCNGGLQFRGRTCLSDTCEGESNDLKPCNQQICPMWSKWGPFSCCNSTCGVGMHIRNRTCINADPGELGCDGATRQVDVCYRAPCDAMEKAVFDNMPCGTRPKITFRISQLRIFLGKKSTPHGWRWQASWQHGSGDPTRWKHVCGAVLIHSRWLVTAAHCIEETPFFLDKNDPGLLWTVVLGMHELHGYGERHLTQRIFVHPKYSKNLVTFNDIALIKLREMVKFTDQIMPICLPENFEPESGELCTVTGWGFNGPGGTHSKSLMEADVPVIEFEKCRSLGDYYRLYLREGIHMCAGSPNDTKADSCTGDSGGPLSCKGSRDQWYLAAVTSFGFKECGTSGHTGIYVPVKHFEKWIRDVVENETYDKCHEH